MKKILTSVFAIAMIAVMMLFVACDESSSSSPYSGNYKEVDAQTLYNVTRDVKGDHINTEPLADERAGITLKMNNSTIMDSEAFKMNMTTSAEGKMVSYANENGEIQTIANFKYTQKITQEVQGMSGNGTNTTTYLYANGNTFYKRYVVDNGIGEATETRTIISKNEFFETIAGYAGMAGEPQTVIPSEESAFINVIEGLCDNKGYRFSVDDSKNLKIKLDVKDKEKYEQNDTGISSPANLDLQKMEIYCIFDKDGNMTAQKMVMDMNSSATGSTMTTTYSMDMRSYTGDVSIPNDLDEYGV